jgi:hypothetical protein
MTRIASALVGMMAWPTLADGTQAQVREADEQRERQLAAAQQAWLNKQGLE